MGAVNTKSMLEILIEPPATGPNAPEGMRLTIIRKNIGKKPKIIRMSLADVQMLKEVLTVYDEKESRRKEEGRDDKKP